MAQKKSPSEIVKNYEEQADIIIAKMYHTLEKAQRKVDDQAYRDLMEKLEKNTV